MVDNMLIWEVTKNLYLKQVARYILTALSMSGAVLVAQDAAGLRALGFTCWIASNAGWEIDAVLRRDYSQLVMFGFFEVTSIVGLINSI